MKQYVRNHDAKRTSCDTQFEQIYHGYQEPIFAYIYCRIRNRMISQELTSNVFLRLWKRSHRKLDEVGTKDLLYRFAREMVLKYEKRYTRR